MAHTDALAHCQGYLAQADDGWLGEIETPLFPPHSDLPDYLVVRAGDGRRWMIAVAHVARVDPAHRLIHLRGSLWELSRLPAWLPLAHDTS